MATWDAVDLLARFRRLASRPTSDASITTAETYGLLEAAQYYWYGQIAVHCPYVLMGTPTLLTSTDGGITYPIGSSVRPLHVEVFAQVNGIRLVNCNFDDINGDYVWEGTQIRMPGNNPRTFANGPYARWIAPPAALDGSNAPTLVPTEARMLLVYHAVAEWAREGGKRIELADHMDAMEHRLAWGVAGTGDVGIVGRLKVQDPTYGASAYRNPPSLMGWPVSL